MINNEYHLTIDHLHAIAFDPSYRVQLDPSEDYKAMINKNHAFLLKASEDGLAIYGMTTGFGSSSANRFDPQLMQHLQKNLYTYHGCGLGDYYSEGQCAAILLARLHVLALGYSGISFDLLTHLQQMINHRIIPAIPSLGSVGASGDLTPLSYVAAAVAGERQVYCDQQLMDANMAYEKKGLKPYNFKAREALAIMNGTTVLTTVAGLAIFECQKIYETMVMNAGYLVTLMDGHSSAFSPMLHERKKHVGQKQAAHDILSWMVAEHKTVAQNQQKAVQDPYSVRCAPHILGVFFDAIVEAKKIVENELNSVSDNPVVDHVAGRIFNGGHFFGSYVSYATDLLKNAMSAALNLVDRQVALLLDSKLNGLSENLLCRNALGDRVSLHHGFKAVQITLTAIVAEVIKKSNPFSVCSRPTESMNQDVVSMGTAAANELAALVQLTQSCVAIQTMVMCQGFGVFADLKKDYRLSDKGEKTLQQLLKIFPVVIEDRAMDRDIRSMQKYLFGVGV